ncbi:MAG: 2-oxoglutarate dehydrogenase E1 component, partial [Alphaproteobacteria bacterium]|nr:2-oxoglutarate dehydrogenase E1 component [Alphaproteobacteria bacterium]
FAASDNFSRQKLDWLEGKWEGMLAKDKEHRGHTGVDIGLLREVGLHVSEIPPNFNPHSKIARQMKERRKMIETGEDIDWGMAETLAFGTMLCESTPIRLSGEDCERGTFSHRHAVLHDQQNYSTITPLNTIRPGQAELEVIDSPLSEFGLLGFEYGYAATEPRAMVIWEAQFGDFANGAQVIIDQFISSSETKWLRMCGLVMLLPHGYEGQGPEHSSARLERYLQLSAEDNWQVCNITSPANFFHVMRRQIQRSFRKPLIVMSPKSLLRHELNVSRLDEFTSDKTFHRVLFDFREIQGTMVADDQVKCLVLCSGKVYFDLFKEREAQGITDVYLMRIEQLYPFPDEVLREEIARFGNAKIIWCQEEPQNNGAWEFVAPQLHEVLDDVAPGKVLHYAGRERAASPATGGMKAHKEQQAALVCEALSRNKT